MEISHPILQTKTLGKRYASQWALQDFSISVRPGAILGIIGPNGSGKTTLLNLITGIIRPTQGHFQWFGSSLTPASSRRFGTLIEKPAFYPWLTARENLKVLALAKKLPHDGITALLNQVGLGDTTLSYQSFSLGMKQRLGLAGALLGSPSVLILDEPTNGVDAEGIVQIRDMILQAQKQGATILLTSHILSEIEKICTDIVMLQKGHIISEEKLHQTSTETLNSFILGCEHSHNLHQQLDELSLQYEVLDQNLTLVHLTPAWTAASLNRHLVLAGIYLDQIYPRQITLEERFLKLLHSPTPAKEG